MYLGQKELFEVETACDVTLPHSISGNEAAENAVESSDLTQHQSPTCKLSTPSQANLTQQSKIYKSSIPSQVTLGRQINKIPDSLCSNQSTQLDSHLIKSPLDKGKESRTVPEVVNDSGTPEGVPSASDRVSGVGVTDVWQASTDEDKENQFGDDRSNVNLIATPVIFNEVCYY